MRFRPGKERDQRQAPTPAQEEGQPTEGALSPAAMWGNPAAAPDGRLPPEPEKDLQRERHGDGMSPRKEPRAGVDPDADTARGGTQAAEGVVVPGEKHPVAASRVPRRFREVLESDEDA